MANILISPYMVARELERLLAEDEAARDAEILDCNPLADGDPWFRVVGEFVDAQLHVPVHALALSLDDFAVQVLKPFIATLPKKTTTRREAELMIATIAYERGLCPFMPCLTAPFGTSDDELAARLEASLQTASNFMHGGKDV